MACLLVVLCLMRSMKHVEKRFKSFCAVFSSVKNEFRVYIFCVISGWILKIDLNTVKTTYRMPYLDLKRVSYGLLKVEEKSVTKKG